MGVGGFCQALLILLVLLISTPPAAGGAVQIAIVRVGRGYRGGSGRHRNGCTRLFNISNTRYFDSAVSDEFAADMLGYFF